jgi:hypothetical protein
MTRLLRSALLGLLTLALLPASALAASHDVTIDSNSDATDFTVTDDGTTKTYTPNVDGATLGADKLETDLLTRDVTVNTGSAGFEQGNITVGSAVSTASTATHALTLTAANSDTINAQMDLAGGLTLNAPFITTIGAPVNASSVVTDPGGTNTVTADITASDHVNLGGTQTDLSADITAQAADLFVGGSLFLVDDSTLTAGGDVGLADGVDGSHALAIDVDGSLTLGTVGSGSQPTSLAVTGNTVLVGTGVSTSGTQTFTGNLIRIGTFAFVASSFSLTGALTGDDTTDVSFTASSIAFAPGSSLGTSGSPLKQITAAGDIDLGAATVDVTTQVWNGPIVLTADTALTGNQVAFGDALDGAFVLTVSAPQLSFTGNVGETTPLASLSATTPNTADFSPTVLNADAASFYGLNFLSGPVSITSSNLVIGDGGLQLSNHSLTIDGGGSVAGPITGTTASVTKNGSETLVLNGDETYFFTTTANSGDLRVNGQIDNDVVLGTGATLSGTGSIGGMATLTGATLSPGASPGKFSISDDLTLDAQSTWRAELENTTTSFDQVAVDGQVDLGGAALVVMPADTLAVGQPMRILDKTSGLDITGTFAGKPEGTIFDVGSVRLKISYAGGDGNDVTLTRLRQPSSLTMSSGPANAVEGSEVTLSATVSGPAGLPSPTGSVTFKDGSTVLGAATVSGGVATLKTSSLGAGDHSLSADFTSDFYDPSSASATQHVDAKPEQTPTTTTSTTPPPPVVLPAITVANANGKESKKRSFVTFVVKLSKASANPVTVKFATKNGKATAKNDFKAKRGTLTFKPGQTSLVVKVQIVNDKRKERAEKFTLVLSAPVGATLARAGATGTIRDDD